MTAAVSSFTSVPPVSSYNYKNKNKNNKKTKTNGLAILLWCGVIVFVLVQIAVGVLFYHQPPPHSHFRQGRPSRNEEEKDDVYQHWQLHHTGLTPYQQQHYFHDERQRRRHQQQQVERRKTTTQRHPSPPHSNPPPPQHHVQDGKHTASKTKAVPSVPTILGNTTTATITTTPEQQQQQQQQQQQHDDTDTNSNTTVLILGKRKNLDDEDRQTRTKETPTTLGGTTTTTDILAATEHDDDDEEEEDPLQIIHIVHTRFMQHQANLTVLGQARLHQFLTFCLPSMVGQSTQNFFWIIKVDPLVLPHHRQNTTTTRAQSLIYAPLLAAIHTATTTTNTNNIYLVGSNYNYNIEGHGGSWRDGQEGEELLFGKGTTTPTTTTKRRISNSTTTATTKTHNNATNTPHAVVYTGDLHKLHRAYALRNVVPILETRLDADDGLHYDYLANLQHSAIERFGLNTTTGTKTTTTTNTTTTVHGDDNTTGGNGDNTTSTNKTIVRGQQQPPHPLWLYWCIGTQMEWHSEINETTTTTNNTPKYYYGTQSKGYLNAVMNSNYCITPGVTVGYNVGIRGTAVPTYQHTELWPALHSKKRLCHHKKDDHHPIHKQSCLVVIGGGGSANTKHIALHAIRSRSLTSAGMNGIIATSSTSTNTSSITTSSSNTTTQTDAIMDATTTATTSNNSTIVTNNNSTVTNDTNTEARPQQRQQRDRDRDARMAEALWTVLEHNFGIEVEDVVATQTFLRQHRTQIAYENSLGQCSKGHSCKASAKEELNRIVNSNNY